ncbi:MAG: phosphoribosylamine--glycine ligase [Candidatus Eremiobacteraeota bacterium]|nr:phosphoribosylamine--glycine ligase [Candidatus Eremiobacteraeota bacterium]MBV8499606.1 phosphoribosylamine--glycine ligase [Candidatus Eremiobacteraeota bacterium]
MRVLVVGNGAREDALSWRIAQSPSCEAIFAAPGNAGTASRGENWDIAATDGKRLTQRALAEHVDLVVLGPETAIAAGVGDRMRDAGLAVFGPNRSGGRLESSKIFAKRFMERHGIPTARAAVVHSFDAARKALDEWSGAVVVKADGLAAGKGVVVAAGAGAARDVLTAWYGHNAIPGGGSDVVLEERLEGREVSVFALCDGRAIVPIGSACDYKRAGDGDTGPNTGGMGAYSPPAGFPDDLDDMVRERILAPLLRGLLAEAEEYVGVLYCGLMWGVDGPRVIEFNARFGDPEAQVLLPRFAGDFAALLKSVADGAMDLSLARVSNRHCVGVVLATQDYPRSNTALVGLNADVSLAEGCRAFWGGSQLSDGSVSTGGGRVLTVTALGDDLAEARARAYASVKELAGRLGTDALTYRTDIAQLP